eukprot:5654288-Alexandrium_andersonii.AAC.1
MSGLQPDRCYDGCEFMAGAEAFSNEAGAPPVHPIAYFLSIRLRNPSSGWLVVCVPNPALSARTH